MLKPFATWLASSRLADVSPTWHLILPLVVLVVLGVASASIYLPAAMQAAAIESAHRSNLEIADQIKITRGYYTRNVVAKALASGALTPSSQHEQDPLSIPLPATFVKDISDLLRHRDTTLTLISPYPWPHRADRKMDEFQTLAWEAFLADPDVTVSRQEVRDGKRVLRVAVADRMTGETCVSCHNSEPNLQRRDWKLGDVRAVMEVTKVIEPYLASAEQRSRTIILSMMAVTGVVIGLLVFFTFVVARRTREKIEAHKKQKKEEVRFQTIMDNAPLLVAEQDLEGRFTFVNSNMSRRIPGGAAALLGKTVDQVFPKDFASTHIDFERQIHLTGKPIQAEMVVPDPKGARIMLFTKFPIFDADGAIAAVGSIAADITEQKRAEARFKAIMDFSPLIVSLKDLKGRFVFINRALERRFGLTADQVIGKTSHDLWAREYADRHAVLERQVAETKTPVQVEMSVPAPNGSLTMLFVKFPLFNANNEIDAIGSIAADITERKRAEAWFNAIMDNAPLQVFVKDLAGRFTYLNRALEQAIGAKAADIIGKSASDFYSREYAEQQLAFERDVVATKKAIQCEVLAPGDRTLLQIDFPIRDSAGTVEAVGGIAAEITEQKQAKAQLAHAQKMDAIGQLTGGIAHDFNNLLTVILGNAEILVSALEERDDLQPFAQVTLNAAERSATLTQRLLAFGRRQTLEARTTDVNELIDGMRDLILRALGEHFKIDFAPAADLWPTVVDTSQLENAILNLLINARDAMPDGGNITVSTANRVLDRHYAEQHPDSEPGEYVMISIVDSGVGMPPEVLARAFEPFFTTKEPSKGTGLGLSTIYGFIQQSRGHVKIESKPGVGTAVRLFLPRDTARVESPTLAPNLVPSPNGTIPGGRERILLVEDNDLVLAHTRALLTNLGYQVATAPHGKAAIEWVSRNGKPDLLLSDVIMPNNMTGGELAQTLRAQYPDLRVLFISGYTEGMSVASGQTSNRNFHFLSKPFRIDALASKVRQVLDARETTEAAS